MLIELEQWEGGERDQRDKTEITWKVEENL